MTLCHHFYLCSTNSLFFCCHMKILDFFFFLYIVCDKFIIFTRKCCFVTPGAIFNARITERDRIVIGISFLFLYLCFTLDSTPCIVHSAFPLGSKSISHFPLLFESFAQQQRKIKIFQNV